jgi:Ca2+/Na+ antiporter
MTLKIIIIAILAVLIVFFIIKKLFKALFIAALFFIAYLVYVKLTGGDPNQVIKDTKNKVIDKIDTLTKK